MVPPGIVSVITTVRRPLLIENGGGAKEVVGVVMGVETFPVGTFIVVAVVAGIVLF